MKTLRKAVCVLFLGVMIFTKIGQFMEDTGKEPVKVADGNWDPFNPWG